MVCNRCIMVVETIFKDMNIIPLSIKLGEIILSQALNEHQRSELQNRLLAVGFELIDSKRIRLIEQIKTIIIELVHKKDNQLKTNISDYISQHIHHDYKYLSNLFTEIESSTIEKFYIAQKIERVKELLVYDELTLSEIANLLNYSSTAHLSTQFKKTTGLTPSHFKQIRENKRNPLDNV